MVRHKKPRQQTIESTLGQPRVRPTQTRRTRRTASATISSPSVRVTQQPASKITASQRFVDDDDVMDLEDLLDDEDEGEYMPMPKRERKKRIAAPGRQLDLRGLMSPVNDDEDEDEDVVTPPSRTKKKGSKSAPAAIPDDDVVTPVSHHRKQGSKSTPIAVPDDSEDGEDEEDDDLPLLPSSASKKPVKEAAASKNTAILPEEEDDSKDDDDDVFLPMARKSQTPRKRLRESSSEEEEEEPVIRRVARSSSALPRSSGRRIVLPVDEDDEDKDDLDDRPKHAVSSRDTTYSIEPSPGKRRRLVRPSQGVTSSSPAKTPRKPRTQKDRVRDQLRKIRERKKSGLPALDEDGEEEETSESEVEGRKALYDSDSDSAFQVLKEFADDSEGVGEEPDPDDRPKTKGQQNEDLSQPVGEDGEERDENDNGGDSDFIVEDDGTAYNQAMGEMPIQFSRRAHKRARDHFFLCVEWLVSLILNPRAEETRRDEDFLVAWEKMEDKVSVLADSKFASSVWREDFVNSLRARPVIESYELLTGPNPFGENNDCGACGRSNHPAKFRVQFTGNIYNKSISRHKIDQFLELVEQDDEDPDSEQLDENLRTIPPESREWFVGTVCHGNAEMVHMLTHWKFALHEWVSDRLAEDGFTSKSHALSRKSRDTRQAVVEEVVENWRNEGVLKTLWDDFIRSINNAEQLPITGKGRGGNRGTRS